MVIFSTSLKSRKMHLTPSDKEGKKLDGIGHKLYSTGALGVKATSYMTCMSQYSYALREQLLEVINTLPEDKNTKCRFLQWEGMLLGKQLTLACWIYS